MTAEILLPALPFHEDEVTQGYFARIGHFHAGVDVGRFCRYTALPLTDFRDGTDEFVANAAALSGVDLDWLRRNTLRRLPDDQFLFRGETLSVAVLRRTTVHFCPQCLAEDQARNPELVQGACRLRWSWLLRSVVSCPVHGTELVECPEPDAVKAFDLTLLRARNEALLRAKRPARKHQPGNLQRYVVSRLEGQRNAAAWLDGQALAQAVKACEMLGALLADGPAAEIGDYTDIDWAKAGDVGFGICSRGAEAITHSLLAIRQTSGRRSGRTGPQAVFGLLYRWLEYTARPEEAGPIRNLLREVILSSFAIGPGEIVLGQKVERRIVHSVNSLKAATGLNPKRLYRLMLKAGMIPANTNDEALNQWVFPAEAGEDLIARILDSVPQNQLKGLLGCSKTQAEQLAAAKLVTSVVPVEEGDFGLSVGAYNRDEITIFLALVCSNAKSGAEESEGFLDLTRVSKGRSSTVEIIRWQIEGQLKHTRLIGADHRIDRLRFSLAEVRVLARARAGTDLHRLTVVADRLGLTLLAVKQLTASEGGEPLLPLVPKEDCVGRQGAAYVSTAAIEKFVASYASLSHVARLMGVHPKTASLVLDERVSPVSHPSAAGIRLYHRQDIETFLRRIDAADGAGIGRPQKAQNREEKGLNCAESTETGYFGEIDASIR